MPDHRIGLHPVGAPQLRSAPTAHRPTPAGSGRYRPTAHPRQGPRAAKTRPAQQKPAPTRRPPRQTPAHRPTTAGPSPPTANPDPNTQTPCPDRRVSPHAGPPPPAPATRGQRPQPRHRLPRSRAHTVATYCVPAAMMIQRVGDVRATAHRHRHQSIQSANTDAIDATRSGVLPDTTSVRHRRTRASGRHRRRIWPLLQHDMRIRAARDRTTTLPRGAGPGYPAMAQRRWERTTALGPGSIAGFHCVKWRLGGIWPRCNARTALMNPAIPAAASK